MRRYSFRLESVLRARRVLEERQRTLLVTAQHEADTAARRLEAERASLRSQTHGAGQATGAVIAGHSFNARREQLHRHGAAVELAVSRRDEVFTELESVRADWSRAKADVAMLERLDENQREVWLTETLKLDQMLTDEIATTRVRREVFG